MADVAMAVAVSGSGRWSRPGGGRGSAADQVGWGGERELGFGDGLDGEWAEQSNGLSESDCVNSTATSPLACEQLEFGSIFQQAKHDACLVSKIHKSEPSRVIVNSSRLVNLELFFQLYFARSKWVGEGHETSGACNKIGALFLSEGGCFARLRSRRRRIACRTKLPRSFGGAWRLESVCVKMGWNFGTGVPNDLSSHVLKYLISWALGPVGQVTFTRA